ncbi:MAG: hypothetical protein JRH20_00910 [Deltaproteobacteria bacterium]|nr:hypothetical protein [Deltaproteobacteria bacterium]
MKKTIWGLSLLLVACVWSSSADANGWKRTNLKSTTNIRLSIDRQHKRTNTHNTKPTFNHTATGYINLQAKNLTDKSRATVIIRSYPNYNGYEYGGNQTVRVNLKPSKSAQYGMHLSGKMPKVTTGVSGYGGNHTHRQSVEVWVTMDGTTWHNQTDPINRSKRFQAHFGL